MLEVVPNNLSIMSRTEEDIKAAWSQADMNHKGYLCAGSLHEVLRLLGVKIAPREVAAFVGHIAGLRHRDMPQAKNCRKDRITWSEFMHNRAKLLATPQCGNMRGPRLKKERNIAQGLPPQRVANATYGGTEDDKRLARDLLDELKGQIRCPGVVETTWKSYQEYILDHPTGSEGAPQIGLFPQVVNTHKPTDYIPTAKLSWNETALHMKAKKGIARTNGLPRGEKTGFA